MNVSGVSYDKIWIPIFDGADNGAGGADGAGGAGNGTGDGKPASGAAGGAPATKTFTQEQLDKIIEERVKRVKTQHGNAITELEALKAKAQLTQQERDELESRIDGMKTEFMTKEEIANREKSKIEKQLKDETERLTRETEGWKTRFTESTISRAITDAAVQHNAYAPKQVVALLRPNTFLAETLDEDGKPSGNLVPKVKFSDVDKDGKPVTLELEVVQAVKRMTELDEFLNLFKDSSSGGVGGSNAAKGAPLDIKKMTPEQYRDARAKGKIVFK